MRKSAWPAGGYGYQKTQFKTGGETDRLNYLVSVSDQELDGYRAQSAYENKQLTGRFDVDLGNDRSLLDGRQLHRSTACPTTPGGSTRRRRPVDPRSAAPGNVQFHAGESLEQTARSASSTRRPSASAARSRRATTTRGATSATCCPCSGQGIVDLDRQFVGGGFNYSYDGFWLDRPNRFIAGVDFDDQDDDRRRYDNLNGVRGPLGFDQNEHVTSQGIFLQNELSVSEARAAHVRRALRPGRVRDHRPLLRRRPRRLGLEAVRRHEPDGRLVVELSGRLNFYTTYSSAFETPTTTEFNRPDGLGGFNRVARAANRAQLRGRRCAARSATRTATRSRCSRSTSRTS